MNEAIKILSQKQETYQQMIDADIGSGEQSALLKEELKLRLSEVAAAIKLLEQFGQHPPDIQKLKEDFFKMFGEQSFRGYPLSQCWDIWEFFLPAIKPEQFRQADVSGTLPPAEITDDAMTIDLYEWVKNIIEGPTGFKVWEDVEWVIHHVSREVSIASFVMRCLANKECEGSERALNAILRRRGTNDR